MLSDAAFIRRLSDADWQEAAASSAPVCAMDGRGLEDLDPAITVWQVACGCPERRVKALPRGAGDGVMETARSFGEALVTIRLFIREAHAARAQDTAGRILSWARGGWFTTGDRPGRRIYLSLAGHGGLLSVRDGSALELRLTAAAFPFWQDARPRRAELSGTGASGSVFAPGYAADALVSVRATARSAVTRAVFKAGSTRIELAGLSLTAGQAIVTGWSDDRHIFFIREEQTGRSLLACRTASSSDELRLPAGKTEKVSVSADGRMDAAFEVRGLYL